jgi:hypothetical protein
MQRVADERRAATLTRGVALGAAPPWASAVTVAALVAGIAIGVGIGRMPRVNDEVNGRVESMPPAAASLAAASAPGTSQREPVEIAAMPSPRPSAAPTRGATSPAPRTAASPRPKGASAGETSFGGGSTLAEEYWQALEGTYGEESSTSSTSER